MNTKNFQWCLLLTFASEETPPCPTEHVSLQAVLRAVMEQYQEQLGLLFI